MEGKNKNKRYKSIPEDKRDLILDQYLSGEHNISTLHKDYDIPYSTLRRFIIEEIRNRGLEDQLKVQYINVEDFPFLKEGYTFQFDETFTIWKVNGKTKKESDKVWILVAAQEKSDVHYINDERVINAKKAAATR